MRQRQALIVPTSVRRFALFSVADLQNVTRDQVVNSKDTKWIGSYARAVVQSGDASGTHSEALNEFFRKNFRKLSSDQALDVINSLAKVSEEPAACLDSKFWVWETLEEALRGDIETLSDE